ncbi:MAG: zinc-binding dehydrogenase [Bacteroidota bacterium]
MDLPKTSQAMVFHEVGKPLIWTSFPLHPPEENEAIVELEYASICGSDLHSVFGKRKVPVPGVLGHEMIGEIVALPSTNPPHDMNGEPLALGDRVSWAIAASCDHCFYCEDNIPQKCESLFKYGHERTDSQYPLSGGFARHCYLAPGSKVVKLPKDIPAQLLSPANCATATTAAAFRLAGQTKGKSILITGAGGLGITAVAYARYLGASQVFITDKHESRLKLATSMGAHHTFIVPKDGEQLKTEILKQTHDRGIDIILEMSGDKSAIEQGIDLLRIGGIMVWVGSVFPQEAVQLNAEQVVRKIITLKGLHNYSGEDLQEAIQFLISTRDNWDLTQLIEKEFTLERINEAFEYARLNRCLRIGINISKKEGN